MPQAVTPLFLRKFSLSEQLLYADKGKHKLNNANTCNNGGKLLYLKDNKIKKIFILSFRLQRQRISVLFQVNPK